MAPDPQSPATSTSSTTRHGRIISAIADDTGLSTEERIKGILKELAFYRKNIYDSLTDRYKPAIEDCDKSLKHLEQLASSEPKAPSATTPEEEAPDNRGSDGHSRKGDAAVLDKAHRVESRAREIKKDFETDIEQWRRAHETLEKYLQEIKAKPDNVPTKRKPKADSTPAADTRSPEERKKDSEIQKDCEEAIGSLEEKLESLKDAIQALKDGPPTDPREEELDDSCEEPREDEGSPKEEEVPKRKRKRSGDRDKKGRHREDDVTTKNLKSKL